MYKYPEQQAIIPHGNEDTTATAANYTLNFSKGKLPVVNTPCVVQRQIPGTLLGTPSNWETRYTLGAKLIVLSTYVYQSTRQQGGPDPDGT